MTEPYDQIYDTGRQDTVESQMTSSFRSMSVSDSSSNPLAAVHHARGGTSTTKSGQPIPASEEPERPNLPTTYSASAVAYAHKQHLQQIAAGQQSLSPQQSDTLGAVPASAPASIPLTSTQQQQPPNSTAPSTSSYLGKPGAMPSTVQARVQAFQQSRPSRSNSNPGQFPPMGGPLAPGSPSSQNHQSSQKNHPGSPQFVGRNSPDLGRTLSSHGASPMPLQRQQEVQYNNANGKASNSASTSSTNGGGGDAAAFYQYPTQQTSQNQHHNGTTTPLTIPTSSLSSPSLSTPVTANSSTPTTTGGGLAGPLFANTTTTGAAQLQSKKPSLSMRRNNKPGNRPKLQLSKEESIAGAGSNAFAGYEKFVDVKHGRLNFENKASLHSKGIKFLSGEKQDYDLSLSDLEILSELGRGNYGTVSKVRHIKTGVEMAMKEIRLELDESKFAQIIMELEVLHNCASPYIVDFYGACFAEGAVYVCIEYMDGGSLDKIYAGGVAEPYLAVITRSVVEGLRELKDVHNIIHRDVKPTNILVSTTGKVKLCDFGVSGRLVASIAKTNIGCQSYMAPERIKSATPAATYTVHSDIWSLGLSILEVAKGSYPYPPETYGSVFSQLEAIVEGSPPDLGEDYSDDAKSFVNQCLNKVPKLRPSYAKLLQHPWLNKYQMDQVDMASFVQEAKERTKSQMPAPKPALHNGRRGV